MRMIDKIVFVSVISVLTNSGVGAADVITVPVSTQSALPLYRDAPFDWGGFYAGIYGATQNSGAGGGQFGAGLNAGVNAQFDFYLLGAEVAVTGLADNGSGETAYGQILGRAGLVVTDDVLLYAAGGYGIDLGPPAEEDVLIGGGVEFAVTDSVSVRAQYLHGFPTLGGNPKDQVAIGASFHF